MVVRSVFLALPSLQTHDVRRRTVDGARRQFLGRRIDKDRLQLPTGLCDEERGLVETPPPPFSDDGPPRPCSELLPFAGLRHSVHASRRHLVILLHLRNVVRLMRRRCLSNRPTAAAASTSSSASSIAPSYRRGLHRHDERPRASCGVQQMVFDQVRC